VMKRNQGLSTNLKSNGVSRAIGLCEVQQRQKE
jgi:hypothetical protein